MRQLKVGLILAAVLLMVAQANAAENEIERIISVTGAHPEMGFF